MNHRQLWERQLAEGLSDMGIALPERRQQVLLDYLAMLLKWNRVYNLTAVREPGQMVSRQILDSLSILQLLRGTRILDVGSGPGLPGIPLAITSRGRRFGLLDSNGKKTRFIQQVRSELKLENLEVVRERVETYYPPSACEMVVSRAFADLFKTWKLTRHLLASDGCLLAMKGRLPADEIEALQQENVDVEVVPLSVPQSDGARHAIICQARSAVA